MTDLIGNGTKRRVFAMLLDNIFATVIALAIASSVPGLGDGTRLLVLCTTYFMYYLLSEALWARTLGKFMCGLRICRYDGRACDWKAATTRTLLRIVEVNPILASLLPAGLAVMFSKRKQRIGDMLAGTVVIAVNERPPAA
jgi:uncharacterized RDD family membrane protein YckC